MFVEDPFAVLGVESTAEPDVIRAAYRALLKKHKPERDPEGFRRIREAFERANEAASRRRPPTPRLVPVPVASPAELVDAPPTVGLLIPPESLAIAPAPTSTQESPTAKGFPAIPEAPTISLDPAPDGSRFALPSPDADPKVDALDALEAEYWTLPDDDAFARARLALDALDEVYEEDIADLLFGAFEGILLPDVRRSLLAPYADDSRRLMKSLIVTFAPTLYSFEQLAALELELDDYDRLALMVEWARRGHPSSAMKLAASLAAKAGNGLSPDVILRPLARLGLELLAAGQGYDALRVRDLMREVDRARPPGSKPWHSIELMRFRALLTKQAAIGASGVMYLAHAALGMGDVRKAKSPPKLDLVNRKALDDDPVLTPLVPSMERHRAAPAYVAPPLTKGRGMSAVTMIVVSISLIRMIVSADCGSRPRSQEILEAAIAEQSAVVYLPGSSDEFAAAIERAAFSRSCAEEFAAPPSTDGGMVLRTSSVRCTLATRAAVAVAAGDCATAKQVCERDAREFVRGGSDAWSSALVAYVNERCPDGGTAP